MVNIQLFQGFHTSQVVSQISSIYSTFSRDPHSHVEGYKRDLYYTFPLLVPCFPWNSYGSSMGGWGSPFLRGSLGSCLLTIVLGVWFFGLPNIFTNSWLFSRGWKVIVDRGDCCQWILWVFKLKSADCFSIFSTNISKTVVGTIISSDSKLIFIDIQKTIYINTLKCFKFLITNKLGYFGCTSDLRKLDGSTKQFGTTNSTTKIKVSQVPGLCVAPMPSFVHFSVATSNHKAL